MKVINGGISLPSSGQDLKKPSSMICQCPEHNTESLETSRAVASSGPAGADVEPNGSSFIESHGSSFIESHGSGFTESHGSGFTESKDSGFIKT